MKRLIPLLMFLMCVGITGCCDNDCPTSPSDDADDPVAATYYYTITHDSVEREYLLYVPESYGQRESVPLLLNFHGTGSNAEQQMLLADFRPIADSEGFLVACPNGSETEIGILAWNIGEGEFDDVGFVAAMIDSIAAEYDIDLERVYSTGMSNGGFFSHHLAGLLSDEIAAIAPVSGTMIPTMVDVYEPTHPTPILHIHGTEDPLVPYDESIFPYLTVAEVLDFWVDYNNCNETPTVTQLPDLDPEDGMTVERIVYSGGDDGVTVEHLKIYGGGHTWPAVPGPGTNDIDACEEIWDFFSQY